VSEHGSLSLSRGHQDASVGRPVLLAAAAVVAAVLVAAGAYHALASSAAAASSASTAHAQVVTPGQLERSRQIGAEQPRFWTRRGARGLIATNASQQLSASFTPSGVQLGVPGGRVALSLVALGRARPTELLRTAAPSARANQVTYSRAGLSEWYANGPLGLEQGVVLRSRPLVGGRGTLTLAYAISGATRAIVQTGQVTLLATDGRPLISYGGLSAMDARGRALPTRLEVVGSQLLIQVQDAGATYPLRIDPLIQGASSGNVATAAALALQSSTAPSLSMAPVNAGGQPWSTADEGVGNPVGVMVTLTNPPGGATVTGVTAGPIGVTPAGALSQPGAAAPPVPSSLAAGATATFTVPYTIAQPGTAALTESMSWTDARGPASATASTVVPLGSEVVTIQTKAWIPSAHLVDPERLLTIPYYAAAVEGNCYTPPTTGDKLKTLVDSLYRGDDHTDFTGSYRVQSTLEFTWDGNTVSNVVTSGDFGETHRDLFYVSPAGLNDCNIQAGTATQATSGSATGASFDVGYASSNPLIFPAFVAPAIDSAVIGSIAPDGTLTVHYAEDLFPSHGIQVSINHQPAVTDTVGDASCLGASLVIGPPGAALLGWGLTHQDNDGSFTVTPLQRNATASAPSLLCSSTYWAIQTTDLLTAAALVSGPRRPATDLARPAAASTVMVAPIVNGKAGSPMSLSAAQSAGLVAVTPNDEGTLISSSVAQPVQITTDSPNAVIATTEIANGQAHTPSYYVGSGKLVVSAGAQAKVTHNGHPVKATKAPKTPVTTATLTGKGNRVTVHFHVKAIGAVTFALLAGHKLPVHRGEVTLTRKQLSKLIFYSTDAFGQVEKTHSLTRAQLRRFA
jgi:hypothetical protein